MAAQLKESDIELLVAKAFVLEATTDKPGCTTRYYDLPDKSLADFIVAGINCSPYFGKMTRDFYGGTEIGIFGHNLDALKSSNLHKSAKFVNFGLLEIMFPTVYARLKTADPNKAIDCIIDSIKETGPEDVMRLLETRQLAWSTSSKPHKINFAYSKYEACQSVWDFYLAMYKDFGADSSNHQWAKQYKEGLPILKAFLVAYSDSGEVIKPTKTVFEKMQSRYPEIAPGIIADMCAAAIFLWLSLNDGHV